MDTAILKKQTTTADELDKAINAMQVSCIASVRYGGKDEKTLLFRFTSTM